MVIYEKNTANHQLDVSSTTTRTLYDYGRNYEVVNEAEFIKRFQNAADTGVADFSRCVGIEKIDPSRLNLDFGRLTELDLSQNHICQIPS